MANILISTALSVGVGLLQRAITPDTITESEGPRLANSQITGAQEGAAVARVFNRLRVGGQLMWATTFREEIVRVENSQGGGKGGPKQISRDTSYVYYCSFAIGITQAEGDVLLNTVYFDGKPADLSGVTYRFYNGRPDQMPDWKMEAVEGAGSVPAYRGLSYIVFEELDLTEFGNRLPQVTVEVTRILGSTAPTSLRNNLRAVNMIPASGEFALATEAITKDDSNVVNIHTPDGRVDVVAALDNLQHEAPAVNSVSLVVAWFGSSLDATTCTVKPKVETDDGTTSPRSWRVSNLTRATADVVTHVAGGTPSDLAVRQTLTDIKARGLRAVVSPVIAMDIAGHPWRGQIAGDGTNLMGSVTPAHYGTWSGSAVPYSGPVQWSLRRMVLHYAALCADLLMAGDAFLIASGMLGVTGTDSAWGTRLAALLADVRTMLPAGVLVSYAADWSEYKAATLAPLWSSADFVGINNYLPLTDWRAGDEVYNLETFMAGVEGGEYWDYHYADDAARLANVRTPIVGAANRQKDIRYWAISNYPGKPVWFTELGCTAVDKGANQPYSVAPYFTSGQRNDTVQRLYIEAMLKYWGDDGFISPANMFVRSWDVRPYPAFPVLKNVWADGDNWRLGHWITGRVNSMALDRLVRIIMLDAGFIDADMDVTQLRDAGINVEGMGVFDVMSPRAILENLMTTYSFDVFEDGPVFRFIRRGNSPVVAVDLDEVVAGSGQDYDKSRTQDTDLPDRTKVTFLDAFRDYAAASVDGHTVTGYSRRVAEFTSMCVLDTGVAKALADTMTQEKWTAKNTIRFSLPINRLDLQPGDTVPLTVDGVTRKYRIDRIVTGDQIDIEAVGHSSVIYEANYFPAALPRVTIPAAPGSPNILFADVPLADPDSAALWSPRVLAQQSPWPGAVNVFRPDDSLNLQLPVPARIGVTVNALVDGKPGIWDRGNVLTVRLLNSADSLSSAADLAVLNGANTIGVLTPADEWEILQFASAVLNMDGTFTLSKLLRGALGTEPFVANLVPAGSRMFVFEPSRWGVLDGSAALMNTVVPLRYGPAGVDQSDGRYRTVDVTPRGVALRPYAPVHLRQRGGSGSDIILSWTRRTRFNGDAWAYGEVPLGEEIEQYHVVIDGGRTLTVSNINSVAYTVAEQIADFGSPQSAVTWTVYQISNTFGRGAPAHA